MLVTLASLAWNYIIAAKVRLNDDNESETVHGSNRRGGGLAGFGAECGAWPMPTQVQSYWQLPLPPLSPASGWSSPGREMLADRCNRVPMRMRATAANWVLLSAAS